MSSRKGILSIASILAISFLATSLFCTPVVASEPEDLILVYDFGTQTLAVNVSHYVSNTKTHYIGKIEILKNGLSTHNQSYTNQSNNWYVFGTFTVSTSVGDNLTVIASCKRGDSITRWLIVTSTTSTSTPPTETTTTTQPLDNPDSPDSTLGAGLAIAGGGIAFIVLVVLYIEREHLPESVRQLGSRIRISTIDAFHKLKTGFSNLIQQIRVRLGSK